MLRAWLSSQFAKCHSGLLDECFQILPREMVVSFFAQYDISIAAGPRIIDAQPSTTFQLGLVLHCRYLHDIWFDGFTHFHVCSF